MRFSGFDDEWVVKKLNDVSNINPKTGDLPETFIYIDLDSVNKGILTKYNQINKVDAPSRAQRCLDVNDILFQTVRPYQMNNLFFELTDNKYVASTGYAQIKSKINSRFLYYYLHYHKFVNNVLSRCTGSNYPAINSTDLKKIKIKIPSSPNEQLLIGDLFHKIDQKIKLLENKHDYYLDFKKYLMQQIFAQKLRFNFTDDWNYMNFSEIFKSVSTKKYQIKSADILDKGDFEVIDQGQDEIAGYFNDKTKLCQELPIIIYGDHTTFVKFRDKPFIVGADGVKLLIPKFNANPKYLFYALEHFNIKPEGYKRHFSIIKKIKLPIPTLEEQNEISEIFNYIDIKLKYTKIQLQETEEFKKGLLQQMFIVRINWRCNFKLAKSPSFNKHLLILKNKIIFIIIK